ncbi:EpsG family protein [Chryseobacterium rhizosphaerae]|uniref:EpsG family protein n=1 Tax=Chryseobacterium rhizosphaerae TaxID=395937 RepID=UPI003D0DE9F5
MWAYYYLFIFSALIGVSPLPKKGKVITLIIILSLFAGTRLEIDNDYGLYEYNIRYIETSIKDFATRNIPMEWCMYAIPNFLGLFTQSKTEIINYSFLIFALLGVGTKMTAISRLAPFFFLSFLLYMSNLYFMQEMTTIRAGVAAGIFLLSIRNIERGENLKFFLKIVLCFFFHSSSVVFVLYWILIKLKIDIKYYYYAVIVSLIFVVLKLNILSILMLDQVFDRVRMYIEAMKWSKDGNVNIFNFKAVFATLIMIIFAYNYKKLKKIEYFDVLFKAHVFSLFLFFILSISAQVFSLRTFEMFSVVQILLYPYLIYVFPPKLKILGWATVFIFTIIQVYYIIDVADIYKPYKSWFF